MNCYNSDISGNPLVSVVMIAYNSEKYIDQAIKGVVTQKTDFPFELIISDDCSTDSTPLIIKRWADRYPNIIRPLRNDTNIGIQSNYLSAFKHCRGRYMAMCDADDFWFHSRKLARQTSYMERHPTCNITFHRVVNYFEDNNTKSFSNGNQAIDTTIYDLAKANYITNMSVVYRIDGIDMSNLPEYLSKEKLLDYSMHMLMARDGNIHFFRRPMGVYRQYNNGTWSLTDSFRRLDMALRVRERLISHFNADNNICNNLRNASAMIIAAMIRLDPDINTRRQLYARAANLSISSSEIDCRIAELPVGITIKRRVLRSIRTAISRMFPLPKP